MTANEAQVDILLVEDNPDDADLALRAVRGGGRAPRVIHVDDGVRALDFMFATGEFSKRAAAALPRVILLDLKLPRMDGLEVLRRLRVDERTRPVPVVMLTSSKEERDVLESYRCGVNSYVVKPVNFDTYSRTLTELVRYWLEINHAATPA